MKKWLWLLLILMIYSNLSAQIKDVVKWTYQLNKISDTSYEAVLTAKIDNGWHLYSKDLPSGVGIPFTMKISSKDIHTIGEFREQGKKNEEFSEAFGTKIIYYSDSAKFMQKFKLKELKKGIKVSVEITFQICNDRVCLAPNTLEFEKIINNIYESKPEELKEQNNRSSTKKINENPITTNSNIHNPMIINSLKIKTLNFRKPLVNCKTKQIKENSEKRVVFFLGFLGGLIALLTPCVFPMIPFTISFFIRNTKNKQNSIIYGLFILLIFTSLSIPFHIINDISGHIFNDISTNIWLNLFFFIIFLFFALNFFGYCEIILPNWIENKSAKAEKYGGLIGIFFMALTLVIVSFSCTGPILGSLLGGVASSSKNIPMLLTFSLSGFGLAWAIVFSLFALFPQALKSLPKSGEWMNTLKIILGFIEISLSLKFLSKADLVSKTFLLKREIFIGLWIIITIFLVLYLFGKIKFPYDRKEAKISTKRKLLGILGIVFILYLIPGLLPSKEPKLTSLSGILPPMNVSIYKNSDINSILGINPVYDYFKAIEIAQKENKPVLTNFTGYGCENCRKMEEFVWRDPDILPIMQNDVILASIHIDDKEELPIEQQILINIGNNQKKKIKTIGDKWSIFQQVNFNNNSQPHYVLVTPDQKVINSPISGYISKEEFKKFLECGINYYKKKK